MSLKIPTLLRLALAFAVSLPTSTFADDVWTEWGGGGRDFQASADGLAADWPDAGPKLVWERPLGDGYSAIVADADRLYTMYHDDSGEVAQEVVVAVDATTGADAWTSRYDAGLPETMNLQFGPGPMSTPALAGGRLFTVGSTLRVHAFDAKDGKVLWSHDLVAELDAPQMARGYGASPLLHDGLVIVGAGAKPEQEGGVVAFRQADGEIAWQSPFFPPSYSSPILGEVGGETQVLVAMGNKRAGLDPKTGEVRWQIELRPDSVTIMSTQIWDAEEQILFGSSAYADGSRAIRVRQEGDAFQAEELWYTRKMRVQHATAVQVGGLVYGSSGDFGPAFLAAVDLKTGELAFRQRGFSKANLLRAGDRLLILDEDGNLALGTPGPDGVEIHAQAKVLERISWTVPTLVGTRLYVRDRKNMKAFELGS